MICVITHWGGELSKPGRKPLWAQSRILCMLTILMTCLRFHINRMWDGSQNHITILRRTRSRSWADRWALAPMTRRNDRSCTVTFQVGNCTWRRESCWNGTSLSVVKAQLTFHLCQLRTCAKSLTKIISVSGASSSSQFKCFTIAMITTTDYDFRLNLQILNF